MITGKLKIHALQLHTLRMQTLEIVKKQTFQKKRKEKKKISFEDNSFLAESKGLWNERGLQTKRSHRVIIKSRL